MHCRQPPVGENSEIEAKNDAKGSRRHNKHELVCFSDDSVFGSVRSSRSHILCLSVCLSVRFKFVSQSSSLAQASFRSILGLSQVSLRFLSALSQLPEITS